MGLAQTLGVAFLRHNRQSGRLRSRFEALVVDGRITAEFADATREARENGAGTKQRPDDRAARPVGRRRRCGSVCPSPFVAKPRRRWTCAQHKRARSSSRRACGCPTRRTPRAVIYCVDPSRCAARAWRRTCCQRLNFPVTTEARLRADRRAVLRCDLDDPSVSRSRAWTIYEEGLALAQGRGHRRRRQRARQAGQPDHHRRLPPGRPPTSTSTSRRQGEDADPLPGTARWCLHRDPGELPQTRSSPASRSCATSTSPGAASRKDGKIRFRKLRRSTSSCAWPRCLGRHGRRGHAPARQQRADPDRPARPAALQPRAPQERDRQTLTACSSCAAPPNRQDHHAALHPELHQHPDTKDLDGRGPGRDHPEGPAPGAGQPQGRSTSPP